MRIHRKWCIGDTDVQRAVCTVDVDVDLVACIVMVGRRDELLNLKPDVSED